MLGMTERKKPNRTGVGLGVYIDPALAAAFSRYIAESRPRTNKTAIVEMLLEEFLREKGYWVEPSGEEERS